MLDILVSKGHDKLVYGPEVQSINKALNEGAEIKGAVLSDVFLLNPD